MDKDILILAPNNENKLDTIYPITKSKNIKCNDNKTLEENLKETNDKIEYVKKLAPEIDNLRDSIKNFKVSIGDAKPEDVLENKTFSNSTEVGLKGSIKNKGNLVITPSKSEQNFAKGLYNNIKCNPVTAETAKQSLSNDDINKIFKEKNPNLKPDNIAKDVVIAGINGTHETFSSYTIKIVNKKIASGLDFGSEKQYYYTLPFPKDLYELKKASCYLTFYKNNNFISQTYSNVLGKPASDDGIYFRIEMDEKNNRIMGGFRGKFDGKLSCDTIEFSCELYFVLKSNTSSKTLQESFSDFH